MDTSIQPMLPEIHRITARKRETYDTVSLTLERPAHAAALAFEPGQFNMLSVLGVGEVAISLSGRPDARELVHTLRSVGTVTRTLASLPRGAPVGVRGPFGHGWPVGRARGRDVVIVAGGIGLAPLRPAIYSILRERELYGRVVLMYGARTPRDILYPKELERWRGRFDVEVGVTVDAASAGWQGDVGVVTTIMPRATFAPDDAVALICGPEIMMRFAVLQLEKMGMRGDAIYISMERNMQCGLGYCGHCQFGPYFVCRDGPVFRYDQVARLLSVREV